MESHILFLLILLPLTGGVFNALFGCRLPQALVALVATAAVVVSFVVTLICWPLAANGGSGATLFTWLDSAGLTANIGLFFDPLAASMTLMVTGVASLIHIYAVGYMQHEKDNARFFALLNLFVFAMLCILLADNLLLLFLGWEGVGLCSYALIGFWYDKTENALAGRKAFIVTRIGDLFFTIALLWLFALCGTVDIATINQLATDIDPALVTPLVLLLLGGACGKSAQLPLMTWLPDAMAGPTPVSALIHAATMVTAGVYLLCRMFPLVSLSSSGMAVIAIIGALTALYAASCALAQREIKRVLAYSTMSQIGYMFLAVGLGSVAAAINHLVVHAFFKALLFMGAGAIIHLAGGENDLFKMGGLKQKHPLLFWLFLAGILCLAGAPLSGGFFSKDAILLAAFSRGDGLAATLWGIGVLTAGLTSFYSFRLLYLVFFGSQRGDKKAHPLSALLIWTLPPLALLGLFGGLLNLPHLYGGNEFFSRWLGEAPLPELPLYRELGLLAVMTLVFAGGWLPAHLLYRDNRLDADSDWRSFLLRGWRFDALYARILLRPYRVLANFCWIGGDKALIDGLVEGVGRAMLHWGGYVRRLATGQVSFYLQGFAWGLLLMLGWLLIKAAV